MNQHTMIIDLSNIGYIAAHKQGKSLLSQSTPERIILNEIHKMITVLKERWSTDNLLIACDSGTYWRRSVYPDYKMNRQNSPLRQAVRNALAAFEQQTDLACISHPDCEADDIIYIATRCLHSKLMIVSTDSDFAQLASERVRLFNPQRNRLHYNDETPGYSLFLKCMRGDNADNIPSAYPRVKKTVLKQAYEYPPLLSKLFNAEVRTNELVYDNYCLNRKLIDLSYVPKPLYHAVQAKILAEDLEGQ